MPHPGHRSAETDASASCCSSAPPRVRGIGEAGAAVGGGSPLRSAPDEDLREEDLARRVARDPDAGQVV